MHIERLSTLPKQPAIYGLYAGQGRSLYVAYVGMAKSLRSRIEQHLVRRDSSIVTSTSAVRLHPEYVTEVRWWSHECFGDRACLLAAEIVATEVLDPVLRSRGAVIEEARRRSGERSFRREMEKLFNGEPVGKLRVEPVERLHDRLTALEERVRKLETAVGHRRANLTSSW